MLAMSFFLSQRFGVHFNTLFFDEIFGHLDNEAQSHVLQLLPLLLNKKQLQQPSVQPTEGAEALEFSDSLSSIFVISHSKEMDGPWNCDYVVRENGSSHIELSSST